MLRLAAKAPPLRHVRLYSEGFDVSKYLSRIEAISKAKPTTHRGPRTFQGKNQQKTKQPQQQQQSQAKAQAKARPQRTAMNTQGARNKQGAQRPQQSQGTPVQRRPAPRQPRQPRQQPVSATASAPAPESPAADDWSSLDATPTDTKPLPRSSRRQNFRKPGSKGKATLRSRSKPERSQKPKTDANVPTYQPFLTPEEALEVVFRNEGTSSGGFIAPIDVSLSALQPNFGQSAVTYNTRVRSLLNSVPNAEQDRAQLEKLVNTYVSGAYFELDAGKNLSGQGLANALNANRSVLPAQKQFFAEVAAGKISPKQIAARA